jgi:hypothetical protein
MCNLYSITANQAAIVALFRVMNRYVGNLPPMPVRAMLVQVWMQRNRYASCSGRLRSIQQKFSSQFNKSA